MDMKVQKYAPIIVPVYDRLEHLQRCISSLLLNKEAKMSVLYVVSDSAYKEEHIKRIESVREYARGIKGFKDVKFLFRKDNMGAHNSIVAAVNDVLKNNDTFIFLEDDIIVSSNFLNYMNDGLRFYENNERVFSICGFSLPFRMPPNYCEDIYFYPCSSPWGFACWKNRWLSVNHDYFDRYSELKNDKQKYRLFTSIGFYIKGILQADSRKEIVADDLRVYYHMFQHNMCSVFPVVSKTQNWGFDGTGEHCGNKMAWWVKPELDTSNQSTRFISFNGYNEILLKNLREFQDKINGGVLAKYLKYTRIHDVYKKIKKRLL
ncbi:glycosyltransferase family 2 protein [Parabacteroides sp.]